MMAYNWNTHHYLIRLGLSFTGGTDVTVKFKAPTDQARVREALASLGVSDAVINTIEKTGDDQPGERYTISTQTAFGNDTDKLWQALGAVQPLDRTQSQIESVGPSLSHEYLMKALWALFIAIGIQFVYIAFRFGWNYIFGTVVVVALVRDALMMIGIYALAGRRADDAFLAAVLTVIGYSVMDTIVILDRIRENVRVMAGEAYERSWRSWCSAASLYRTSRSRCWWVFVPAATIRSFTPRRSFMCCANGKSRAMLRNASRNKRSLPARSNKGKSIGRIF
jgi:preprotein translocase SecF subunit